jgi:hypothetical protein
MAHPRDKRPDGHEDSTDQQIARPHPLVEDFVVQQADDADNKRD